MPDYPRRRLPQDHLPLTVPVFQILLSLSDQDLHGYAIIQDIRARTAGEVTLTASTLYAAIRRLLDAGLVEELEERPARTTIRAGAITGSSRRGSTWPGSRPRGSNAP